MILPCPWGTHWGDDQLEAYSLGWLSEGAAALLKDHLIVCAEYQDRQLRSDEAIGTSL